MKFDGCVPEAEALGQRGILGLESGRLTGILALDHSAGQVERGPRAITNSRFFITLKSWWGFKEISVKCLISIFLGVDSDGSCFLTCVGLCTCVTSRRCLYIVGSHRGRWQSRSWQGVARRHQHVWPERRGQNETQPGKAGPGEWSETGGRQCFRLERSQGGKALTNENPDKWKTLTAENP